MTEHPANWHPGVMLSIAGGFVVTCLSAAVGYNWQRLDSAIMDVATIKASRFTADDGDRIRLELSAVKEQLAGIKAENLGHKLDVLTERFNERTQFFVQMQTDIGWIRNELQKQEKKP